MKKRLAKGLKDNRPALGVSRLVGGQLLSRSTRAPGELRVAVSSVGPVDVVVSAHTILLPIHHHCLEPFWTRLEWSLPRWASTHPSTQHCHYYCRHNQHHPEGNNAVSWLVIFFLSWATKKVMGFQMTMRSTKPLRKLLGMCPVLLFWQTYTVYTVCSQWGY